MFYFLTIARASPCEAELQELMEQIDIMVSNKKLDWERKMRALETRLDLRDQELANAQTCLDQKGQEVLSIRVNKMLIPQTLISNIYSIRIWFSLCILLPGISCGIYCLEFCHSVLNVFYQINDNQSLNPSKFADADKH